MVCLGGWHIRSIKDDAESIRVMHAAIDEGINFFDNAWDYWDGAAEEIMGKALAMDGRRGKVFLMTKNCNRDYAGSMKCLEDSLRRLRTDHLDLWQLHDLRGMDELDTIFGRGGALEAAVQARAEGRVAHIGITGHHDPTILLEAMRRFDFDTVLVALNPADPHRRPFIGTVLAEAAGRGMGVIAMKTCAQGPCSGGAGSR